MAALTVRVLDAEDELTAVVPGQGQVEEGHVGGAHVGVSGRARGDASS